VRAGMLHLGEFTIADLARYSATKPESVRSVVRRHGHWLTAEALKVAERPRGGQALKYALTAEGQSAIRARMGEIERNILARPDAMSQRYRDWLVAEDNLLRFVTRVSTDRRRVSERSIHRATVLLAAPPAQVSAARATALCWLIDLTTLELEAEVPESSEVELRRRWYSVVNGLLEPSPGGVSPGSGLIADYLSRVADSPLLGTGGDLVSPVLTGRVLVIVEDDEAKELLQRLSDAFDRCALDLEIRYQSEQLPAQEPEAVIVAAATRLARFGEAATTSTLLGDVQARLMRHYFANGSHRPEMVLLGDAYQSAVKHASRECSTHFVPLNDVPNGREVEEVLSTQAVLRGFAKGGSLNDTYAETVSWTHELAESATTSS
jgi:hypothetical protein